MILTALRELVVTGAALTGAIVAVRGLNTWRRHLRGKSDFELARRTLFAAFRVRDGIAALRTGYLVGTAEVHAAVEAGVISAADAKDPGKATDGAYNLRWGRIADAYNDLLVDRLEAEAIWGKESAEKISILSKCVSDLKIAVMFYLRDISPESKRPKLLEAKRAEIDRVVFADEEDPDRFAARVEAAVKQIEDLCKPHLGAS